MPRSTAATKAARYSVKEQRPKHEPTSYELQRIVAGFTLEQCMNLQSNFDNYLAELRRGK